MENQREAISKEQQDKPAFSFPLPNTPQPGDSASGKTDRADPQQPSQASSDGRQLAQAADTPEPAKASEPTRESYSLTDFDESQLAQGTNTSEPAKASEPALPSRQAESTVVRVAPESSEANELAVLKSTQADTEQGGPLTTTPAKSKAGTPDKDASKPMPHVAEPAKPAQPDPRQQRIETRKNDVQGHLAGAMATAMALGPDMAGPGAEQRLRAAQQELSLVAQQNVLATVTKAEVSEAERENATRKIERMEMDRLKTRLAGETAFAQDLMAKGSIALGMDGTPRPKTAILASSAKYISSLAGIQGDMARDQSLMMQRDTWQASLGKAQEDRQQLQRKADETRERYRQTEESLFEKQSRSRSLRENLMKGQAQEGSRESIERDTARQAEEIRQLASDIARLKEQRTKLEQEMKAFDSPLAEQDATIRQLQGKVSELDRAIAPNLLETAIKAAEAEHTFLVSMMRDANNPAALAAEAAKAIDRLSGLLAERTQFAASTR
jgi:predicted  nucleic acid-binding Zn-ribbon protein